ncbi:MAG: NAD-binding protein [Anaerolineales bacterium]
MPNKLTVGYIGLGLMGKPMARNILRAGYPLVVHNRSRAAVNELAAEGAKPASSPAQVAGQVDVVFTNLPDSPDVELVALGKDGIIEGTLAIMVGGPDEALEKVMPVFQVIGEAITHVGGPGAGQIAKAANQIMVAAQMVAMAELLVFARKAGANPEKVVQAIRGGAAQCWTLDVKPQRLFEGKRNPGFKAYMQAKDLGIVLDTARQYGIPLPAAAVHTQLFNAMLEMGMENLDNSAVIGVIESLAGTALLNG